MELLEGLATVRRACTTTAERLEVAEKTCFFIMVAISIYRFGGDRLEMPFVGQSRSHICESRYGEIVIRRAKRPSARSVLRCETSP